MKKSSKKKKSTAASVTDSVKRIAHANHTILPHGYEARKTKRYGKGGLTGFESK